MTRLVAMPIPMAPRPQKPIEGLVVILVVGGWWWRVLWDLYVFLCTN